MHLHLAAARSLIVELNEKLLPKSHLLPPGVGGHSYETPLTRSGL